MSYVFVLRGPHVPHRGANSQERLMSERGSSMRNAGRRNTRAGMRRFLLWRIDGAQLRERATTDCLSGGKFTRISGRGLRVEGWRRLTGFPRCQSRGTASRRMPGNPWRPSRIPSARGGTAFTGRAVTIAALEPKVSGSSSSHSHSLVLL